MILTKCLFIFGYLYTTCALYLPNQEERADGLQFKRYSRFLDGDTYLGRHSGHRHGYYGSDNSDSDSSDSSNSHSSESDSSDSGDRHHKGNRRHLLREWREDDRAERNKRYKNIEWRYDLSPKMWYDNNEGIFDSGIPDGGYGQIRGWYDNGPYTGQRKFVGPFYNEWENNRHKDRYDNNGWNNGGWNNEGWNNDEWNNDKLNKIGQLDDDCNIDELRDRSWNNDVKYKAEGVDDGLCDEECKKYEPRDSQYNREDLHYE